MSMNMKLFLVLAIATLLLVQAFAEASQAQDAGNSVDEGNAVVAHLLKKHHPKIKRVKRCKKACGKRCKKASKRKRCMRACTACCAHCHCVPPGTYGRKNACPCYARLKTHGNKPKCP